MSVSESEPCVNVDVRLAVTKPHIANPVPKDLMNPEQLTSTIFRDLTTSEARKFAHLYLTHRANDSLYFAFDHLYFNKRARNGPASAF